MEREGNQFPPTFLCRSGCGFYGSPATDYLCSKCYKENLRRLRQRSATQQQVVSPRMTPSATVNPSPCLDTTSQKPILPNVSSSRSFVPNFRRDPSLFSNSTASSVGKGLLGCNECAPEQLRSNSGLDRTDDKIDEEPEDRNDDEMSDLSQQDREMGEKDKNPDVLGHPAVIGTDSKTSFKTVGTGTSLTTGTSVSQISGTSNQSNSTDCNKPRCDVCKKRLGLASTFECRCGGKYCCLHRYSDKHNCRFDYRTMGRNEIRKNNPVVQADKVKKL